MQTHPLWRPFEQPTDEEVAAARTVAHAPAPVEVVAPDPTWPADFEVVRRRLVAALGDRVLALAHVGSTSVPGLWAKPVIDVDLTVASSADEPAWLPDLEAAGFELRVREPGWEQHRLVVGSDPDANVHVWSPGALEVQRHAMFRDRLISHDEDRASYAALKRSLGARGFTDSMHYNNAKGGLIYDLYEKIYADDPRHPHDPHPRVTTA